MNRALAAVIALLLLLSLLRTRGVDASSPAPAEGSVVAGGPLSPIERELAASAARARSPAPPAAAAQLRLEILAEIPFGGTGPPIVLRWRAREGATQPFDVTVQDAKPGQRLLLDVPLPLREPELPLRGELVGDDWCIPPGQTAIEVARIDRPYRLVLERARVVDVELLDDRVGTPVAGAALVHEGGVALATTGPDGRAHLLRPKNAASSSGSRRDDAVVALATGFLPAVVPDEPGAAAAVVVRLRERAAAGTLRGRVVDPSGAPVAGVRVVPTFEPFARPITALAVKSGADGSFELAVPWPGRLVVTARHRQLGRASASLADARLAEAGHVAEVELRFPPSFELRASVTRAGRPLAGASVELVEREGAATSTVAAAITGADGRASLKGPAIEPLWLVARAEGVAPEIRELVADPQRGVDASFELVSGRTVTCVVTGSDVGQSAVRVLLWRDAASGLPLGESALDFTGRVRLDHVPAGRKLELLYVIPGSEGIELRDLELPALPQSGADAAAGEPLDLGSLALPDR